MTLPRLLVTGGAGLVGGALVAAAARSGRLAVHATRHAAPPPPELADAATWHGLDVTDAAATRALVAAVRPAVVVHAAVATGPSTLVPVTVDGAAHVARAAREAGAALVHLSSDMVFDGAHGPYDEASAPAPITPYGHAKAAAEQAVRAAHPRAVIARLPLLYRLDPPDRALAAWLAAARAGHAYPLFVDEIRCPAHVPDVAAALLVASEALAGVPGAALAADALPPVVHLPGPQALSRHDFGCGVLAALGLPASLAIAGRSADAPAPRPRELDLRAPGTPAALRAPLRAPSAVFSARARPTPPAGPASAR